MNRLLNGLEFEFIDSIDGYEDIDISELLKTNQLSREYKDPVGLITRGIVGCALSHKKAWETFIESGSQTAVFFEDDIIMTRDIFKQPPGNRVTDSTEYTTHYKEILDELYTLDDWDVIFLGKKMLFYPGDVVTKNVVKPIFGKNGWGAHSYVLNKRSAKKLVKKYSPIEYAADVFLETTTFDGTCYGVNPSLFRQESDLILYGKYEVNQSEIDSDTFNNTLESGKRQVQTIDYASFGGYVENFVESCRFTNFDGSPFLTLKLRED
jgi:GR25 family glycosyltransferase involved in LPS biosynthesis